MKKCMLGLVFVTPFCTASDTFDIVKSWPKTNTVMCLKEKNLTGIPAYLDRPGLKILLLSHNKIEAIPDMKCPQLISFFLDHNNVVMIPKSLELESLNTFDLTGNKIRFIDAQHLFKQFPKLTRLVVRNNPISQKNIAELRIVALQYKLKAAREITIESDWDDTSLEYGFCEELDEIYQKQFSRL